MRILVIADLHLDLWDHARRDPFGLLLPIFQTLDAVLIAGDLANDPMKNWPGALERIGRLIEPSKVWVMPGNHDYYGLNLAGDDGLRALAERAGMHFAQKTSVEFGGVRFLCCTLWTNIELHSEKHVSMITAQRSMNDYFQIPSCLIPRFAGAILSLEWKDALWDKFVMAAPRPRTLSEQQYSDRKSKTCPPSVRGRV